MELCHSVDQVSYYGSNVRCLPAWDASVARSLMRSRYLGLLPLRGRKIVAFSDALEDDSEIGWLVTWGWGPLLSLASPPGVASIDGGSCEPRSAEVNLRLVQLACR